MKYFKSLFLCLLFAGMAGIMKGQTTEQQYNYSYKWTADRGNGTFLNPIVNGDFPDCDVIRVGDTFYFVSTTMYHFPGATLLKSKDLVNWEYCANPLQKIGESAAYDLNGASHYSQGQWAASLNYHDGKFYIYFICYGRSGIDDTMNILLTAEDPEGEWTMTKMSDHYYDAGWLFDDGENGDGYLYVACGISNLFVNKLNAKTLTKISSTQVVKDKDGYEGSHMYHIGDYYYLYVTTGGYWKGQTIYRSKNPMGPYEEVPYTLFQGDAIHQGALVDTPTGEWWTILFKDAGAIGRVPYLEPVKWVNGWPVIGDNGRDVSRNGAAYRKPKISEDEAVQNADYRTYLPTNDSFSTPELGMQWQWNHNPQKRAWSLTDRQGWMRLYSCTVTDNVVWARGSLTQRMIGYSPNGTSASAWKQNVGTTKLDLSGMKEGDVAGLAVWQSPYSFIGVKVKDGKKYLFSQRCSFSGQVPKVEQELNGAEIKSDTIYLRAMASFGTNVCNYYYSYNGISWIKWGVTMNMGYTLDFFVGQRYYLFNYSTKATGGHVDIDWFSTERSVPEDYFAQLDEANKPEKPSGETEVWTGFDFMEGRFDASIVGTGTVSYGIKSIETSKGGFAGWIYPQPWDVSEINYLVASLLKASTSDLEIRIYDSYNVWAEPYVCKFGKNKSVTIDLHNMQNASGETIDPSHICMIGFSSDGSAKSYVKSLMLSDDGLSETAVEEIEKEREITKNINYDLSGRRTNISPLKTIKVSCGNKALFRNSY